MIAATVETIRDLGLPTIAGAVAGALIAHFTAKARGREEHQRTLDLLVTQDERRAAQGALDAIREIKNRINAGSVTSYGELHNEWSDRVLAPARLVRSDDLDARARAGAYMIFLATLVPEDYAAVRVRGGLSAQSMWRAVDGQGQAAPAMMEESLHQGWRGPSGRGSPGPRRLPRWPRAWSQAARR